MFQLLGQISINKSIIVFCPMAGLSLQTQHSLLYPLLSLPFRIFIQSVYHNIVRRLISSSASNFLLFYHSFQSILQPGSSFLASGPAHFFSSSLSVPALFFLLPLFLAQLHFLFCLSILHASSFSITTSQMLPVVFAYSVVVCRSLHHTTLHSTQNTSIVSSVVLFPMARRKCFFSVKDLFCHCYPLLYFLTAVHVATGIIPQVFEAVHLFNGFTFNSSSFLKTKLRILIIIWITSSARGFARLFKKIYNVIRQAVCFSGHWQKCFISNIQ